MALLDVPLTRYLSPCRQFDRLRALREHHGDRAVLAGPRFRPAPWEYRLRSLQHRSETPQLAILDAGQGASEALPHGFMEIALP